ncbi:sulfatase [Candidatus Hydrogenedentota bacterium]
MSKISRRHAIGVMGGTVAGVALSSGAAGQDRKKKKPASADAKKKQAKLNEARMVRGKGPNILMVMADQFNHKWMGCAGADWVKTPNLDALAERGVLFTKAICNYSLCSPSRAALASGLRSSQVGVMANGHLYPPTVPTYYQALRASGYRVGCVGKTDLHKNDHWEGVNGDRPIMYHLGFTDPYELEGKQTAAIKFKELACPYQRYLDKRGLFDKFNKDYGVRKKYPRKFGADSVLPLEAYEDSFIGDHTCEFLENVSDESPWHYFTSFVGPHNPWDAPTKYADMYRKAEMPEEIRDPNGKKPFKREDLVRTMRQYAGMVTLIDDYVGKMVEILKERGMYDNTVIMFCADHGEMMGDHGMFYKGQPQESAIRIPMIVAGPGIKSLGKLGALVELNDLAPTCLELAKTKPLGKMTARSLMPILTGKGTSVRDFQICEGGGHALIFDGRYKYIDSKSRQKEGLFDIDKDPSELNNLIEKEPGKAAHLKKELAEMLASEKKYLA